MSILWHVQVLGDSLSLSDSSCLASALMCPVPAGTPVVRAEELYISHILRIVLEITAHKFTWFPLDYISFTSKCQSKILSVEKQQDKLVQTICFCLVMLCQVRLPSFLALFLQLSPGILDSMVILTQDYFWLWLVFVWAFFSVFLDISWPKYCLTIDEINLYGAKCKGK